ncbi:hypothetical protein LCL95_08600 [Bacillus timonensis]|nr:hypothetical protein [Bacillus timonensis]
MRKIAVILGVLCIVVSFLFNLLGLMRLVPLYITIPPLFLSLLFTITMLNYRNQFKGFK